MKNLHEEIVYIGKSVALNKRVKSYFSGKVKSAKTQALINVVQNIEFIVTENEVEALILENNLIKKHKPRYNILLKDSKTHPYIKVSLAEKIPRLQKVRKVNFKDGNLYFGPFPNAYDLERITNMLSCSFKLCTATKKKLITISKTRPCLKYHINACQGVCQGKTDINEYLKSVQKAVDILSGKVEPDFSFMNEQLNKLVNEYRYEEAAEIRDTIQALNRFFANQKVEFVKPVNADIWGVTYVYDRVVFSVFFIRAGKLTGNKVIDLTTEPDSSVKELFTTVINRFYDKNLIVRQIFSTIQPESKESLELMLQERCGHKVNISTALRGRFYKLQQMADSNAKEIMRNLKSSSEIRISQSVVDLQKQLKLKTTPIRIECVDISHLQGVDPVASVVVFENGAPLKSNYRLYHIKHANGGDDPASIAEVTFRRFSRLQAEGAKMPDLFIVDGGITQLRAAKNEVEKLNLDINLLGLAKKHETIVYPDGQQINMPHNTDGLRLVVKLRNEAHRFANSFRKKSSSKRVLRSSLLNLPGVGPAILKKLIYAFGSIKNISKADANELKLKAGVPIKIAKIIVESFKKSEK